MYKPSQPMQFSQMIHRPFKPVTDPFPLSMYSKHAVDHIIPARRCREISVETHDMMLYVQLSQGSAPGVSPTDAIGLCHPKPLPSP